MKVSEILDSMSKMPPPVPEMYDLKAIFAHRLAAVESKLSPEEFASFIEVGAVIGHRMVGSRGW